MEQLLLLYCMALLFAGLETGTDKRDYCWVPSASQEALFMMVYTGKKWKISPADFITGDIITVIEADNLNNIWIGTYRDGIFILNQ